MAGTKSAALWAALLALCTAPALAQEKSITIELNEAGHVIEIRKAG